MSISLNSHCVDCLLKKHNAAARDLGDPQTAYAFSKAVMTQLLQASPEDNSAILGARINRLYMDFYGLPQDRYRREKALSNQFVIQRLDGIRQAVSAADDPVLTALQYAIMGNYMDFSALGSAVSFDALEEMLRQPERFAFDTACYRRFCRELEQAQSLLLITDNAGELGFDWVLADALTEKYPQLKITFCVRGMPAHNDATREDYEQMRIPYPVIDSGSDIGGTELRYISDTARAAIQSAQLIIAKGMGNTETLYGSGLPVYFAFLVKCKRFEEVFGQPHMTPMFLREP